MAIAAITAPSIPSVPLMVTFRRWLRATPRSDGAATLTFTGADGATHLVTRAAFSAAIDRLRPLERKVVRLHWESDETIEAIANDCHVCTKTLEITLRRVVALLSAPKAFQSSLAPHETLPLTLAERGRTRRVIAEFLRIVPRADEDDFVLFTGFDGHERRLTRKQASKAISRMQRESRARWLVMVLYLERHHSVAYCLRRLACSEDTFDAELEYGLDILATLSTDHTRRFAHRTLTPLTPLTPLTLLTH